jgi:energy-coupling factor transporter ATP-binding protein EcfA2
MSSLVSSDDLRLSRVATGAPRVPWGTFVTDVFTWGHGEHVALIGPTGQGKTTLMRSILPLHPYVVIFATKPRDDSMDSFIRSGYVVMSRWQSIDPVQVPRRVLWPNATSLYSEGTQAEVFRDAMERIYREGAWTVAVDELWFLTNKLKLSGEVKTYLLQARSLDISFVAATQKPAWVPTEVYDQSTHLFLWRNNDARAQQRLGEINNADAALVRDIIARLEMHQLLYINTRTGQMVRTRVPPPSV